MKPHPESHTPKARRKQWYFHLLSLQNALQVSNDQILPCLITYQLVGILNQRHQNSPTKLQLEIIARPPDLVKSPFLALRTSSLQTREHPPLSIMLSASQKMYELPPQNQSNMKKKWCKSLSYRQEGAFLFLKKV
jgi:hypothetical protein